MRIALSLPLILRPAAGPQDHVHLEGGGLEDQEAPDAAKLSYSAPDEDGAPSVSGAQQAPQQGAAGRAAQAALDGDVLVDAQVDATLA